MAEPTREEKRQALAQLVQGKTDEEILAGIVTLAVDTLLTQLFTGMAEAFIPERAAGKETVIQYDVKVGEAVHPYQIKVAAGTCQMQKGTPEPAKVTMSLGLADLLRLASDQIKGPQLFMSGKLKIQGDMAVAMVMQQWFQA